MKYCVTVIDSEEEVFIVQYERMEYRNLMELISNNYYDTIGECRGRGLCKTCWVQEVVDENIIGSKHLSCQIEVTENIDNKTFKINN